eukprot:ANDGO_04583.mRNA.1 Phosducin-like protein 2
MSNPYQKYESDWVRVQRKYGNISQEEAAAKQLEELVEDAIDERAADPYAKASDASLRTMEEEAEDRGADDDAEFLANYRKERVRQMQELKKSAVFGAVQQIRKVEWEQAVTQTSRTYPVIVLLFEEGYPDSEVVQKAFKKLAARYPSSKFVEIYGKEAIQNYPRDKMPTILVYKNADVAVQFIGIGRFVFPKGAGHSGFRDDFLEWELHRAQAIQTRGLEMPEEYEELAGIAGARKDYRRISNNDNGDGDDDDREDDD